MTVVRWILVFVTLMQGACSIGLPELKDLQYSADIASIQEVRSSCEKIFTKSRYQFVHSITFQLMAGYGTTVIGVTVLDGDTIKTGIMGVEGFALFEAILSGEKQLEVSRALPPFDNPEFAEGLMRDVRAIFYSPMDKHPRIGRFSDGTSVCRYSVDNNQITDIQIEADGRRIITSYDAENNKSRSILFSPPSPIHDEMMSKIIELKAYGLQSYTIHMILLTADKIDK